MPGQSKKVEHKKKYSTFKAIEKIHPHKMILYLALFGSFLIFGFMAFAYAVGRMEIEGLEHIVFPKAFAVSTVILLLSSYTVTKILPSYKKDNLPQMKDYLAATLSLTLIFIISQIIGWMELKQAGLYLSEAPAVSFLVVITGLHLIHMAAGFVILVYFLFRTWRLMQDPVRNLIVSTNPYEKVKLEMFAIFWHCMGFFWLFIYFFFHFTF